MSEYFEAPCLDVLERELNTAHPSRDKRSDGWIGDAAHSARPSGHNPDWSAKGKTRGVVRARDVDKDGPDMYRLLQLLIKDVRTDYVIWRGKIWSRVRGFRPIRYTGANGHFEHMHVQIRKGYEFDTRTWGYLAPIQHIPVTPAPVGVTLRKDHDMFVTKYGSTRYRMVTGDRYVVITEALALALQKQGVPLVGVGDADETNLATNLRAEGNFGE